MTSAAEFASQHGGRPSGSGWVAKCPGHEDAHASLSINEGDDGKLLLHCFAGCSFEDILRASGVEAPARVKKTRPALIKAFEYRDADSKLLYIKKRWEPGFDGGRKSFSFEHNGKKGRGGNSVLYNLPALAVADTVFIVEGEAKADLLNEWGLTATCLDSGANSPWKPAHTAVLTGKNIISLPDNDKPGQGYANKIAKALNGKGKSIKVVELPGLPEKGDILDWAPQKGNDKTHLLKLVEAAPEWTETPSDAPAPQALKKVPLENIEHAELAPPEYAIGQLIPKNEITLLGAHGGAGKSMLALILAAHYACGRAWCGFEVAGGRVVYISLEDPAAVMLYRLKKICEVYGLPYDLVIKNLVILDGSDIDGTLAAEVSDFGVRSISMTPLFDEVKVACHGAGLLIIDNASDAFGGNEISRLQVRGFIRAIRNGLARPNNAGVVLLAHIDKAGARNGTQGNTYSGSTAWHNSVRSRLALTAKQDGGVQLAQEKLNLGKKLGKPIVLSWAEGVLIPAHDFLEDFDEAEQESADKEAVLEAIRAAIADGEDVPTARTGPRTTQLVLEKYPDLPKRLRGKKGRDNFYAALTTLQRESTLTTEEYTTASRNTRQRFCVNSDVHTYTPIPPRVEPTKPTQGFSSVARVALKTGTNETNETNADVKSWVFTLPDGTVLHTQPSDTAQGELVI